MMKNATTYKSMYVSRQFFGIVSGLSFSALMLTSCGGNTDSRLTDEEIAQLKARLETPAGGGPSEADVKKLIADGITAGSAPDVKKAVEGWLKDPANFKSLSDSVTKVLVIDEIKKFFGKDNLAEVSKEIFDSAAKDLEVLMNDRIKAFFNAAADFGSASQEIVKKAETEIKAMAEAKIKEIFTKENLDEIAEAIVTQARAKAGIEECVKTQIDAITAYVGANEAEFKNKVEEAVVDKLKSLMDFSGKLTEADIDESLRNIVASTIGTGEVSGEIEKVESIKNAILESKKVYTAYNKLVAAIKQMSDGDKNTAVKLADAIISTEINI